MKNGYKALVFDLDGTLINSLPLHLMAFKDLLLERGIRMDEAHLKTLMGMPTADILKVLKKKYRIKEDVQELREERRYHYFKFLGKRDITFAGVKATLSRLRLKYKLAVATGSSQIVFTHSTDKDFQELFDEVVTIDHVKHGKPKPEQLVLAAHRLKLKPKACIMVGDSVYDAMAAKAAGMGFIGVTTGYTTKHLLMENGAMAVINSIKQLPGVLK